jgi:hypothetical protein
VPVLFEGVFSSRHTDGAKGKGTSHQPMEICLPMFAALGEVLTDGGQKGAVG